MADDGEALVAFARLVAEHATGLSPDDVEDLADAERIVGDPFAEDVEATYADIADTARRLLDRIEQPAVDDDERRHAARMLRAVAPHLHSSSLVPRFVALVHDDAVGTDVRGALDRLSDRLDDDDLAALADGDDPAERESALWYAVTRKVGDERLLDLVFDALGDDDPERREFASRWLWTLPDAAADRLPRLLELAGDDQPEVRAAAISGAARLVHRDEEPGERGRPRDAAEEVVAAVAEALGDDDPRVRRRAAGIVDVERWVRDDELWEGTLSFETRWRLATWLAAAANDREALVADRASATASEAVRTAACGDAAAVPALVDYGWPADEPASEAAREGLADLAEEAPGAVASRADVAVEALATGTATAADARLLAAVAAHSPAVVADAAADLAALLDGEDDRRREAARALAALRRERPDAVSVDVATLVEATDDVTDDGGRLDPERLVALADVDPDRAAAVLADVCETRAPEDHGHRPARAIERLGDAHPEVVSGAAGAVVAFLDSLEPRSMERAASGIAAAAGHDPGAFARHAADLAAHVDAIDPDARTAITRALHAVGTADPDALPAAVRPLAERPPDPADPAWPFGVVAANDPGFAEHALVDDPGWLDRLGDARREEAAGLLVEAAAGDETVARAAVDRLARGLGEDSTTDRLGTIGHLADEDPGLAAEATEALVALLATRSGGYGALGNAEEALEAIASHDPERVRAAVEAEFGSPGAFVEHEARHRKRRRERIVEAAFDREEDEEDGRGGREKWTGIGVDLRNPLPVASRWDEDYADAFGHVADLLDEEVHAADVPDLRFVAAKCYPHLFETVRNAVDRER